MSRAGPDVAVVGAGLGGLLTAAWCARAGASVLVVERLGWVGGRFTTHWSDGYGLSSGALHFVPHGATGPLASLLAQLGLPGLIEPAALVGSVRTGRRHVFLRRPADILRLCGPADALELLGELVALKRLNRGPVAAGPSFAAWLRHRSASPRLARLWQTFADFALSVDLDELPTTEMRAVVRNVARLGDPGVIRGGCGAVTEALARYIGKWGGDIALNEEVVGLKPDRLRLRRRPDGPERDLPVKTVVSNIGPAATARLMGAEASLPPPARGVKVHLSSPVSRIPHSGIMFWLDGRQLSGAVQPTNIDPGLAPPGRHLLIAFGALRSGSLRCRRRLAMEDARTLFGRQAEILSCTTYTHERWPVNRAVQGQDVRSGFAGVHLVGDGCKPSGFMMADGVAKSVELALTHMGLMPAAPPEGAAGIAWYARRSLQAARAASWRPPDRYG